MFNIVKKYYRFENRETAKKRAHTHIESHMGGSYEIKIHRIVHSN